MEAFFRLPVASSSVDLSSSLSDGAGSVGVGDGDGFFLAFLALGGLGGSLGWEPVVSPAVAATAAVKA